MNAGEVRRTAAEWVSANQHRWPGLVAAHLVGGITALPAEAQFPAHKDVDIHLVVAAGSPLLQQMGPMLNVVEEYVDGIAIEAGFKSAGDYASPEVVLANPEIAHHFLQDDIVLYDPDGMLAALLDVVRKDYARRKWVEARVNYERNGFEAALGLRPMAAGMYGESGQAIVLGYAHTYLVAALQVSQLRSPAIGGRSLVRLRGVLEEVGRLDLAERVLEVLGLVDFTPARARQIVADGAALFDIAVESRRTPHPFQHKFFPHLRRYFVDSCHEMIDEGYHREAAGWATPFVLTAADIIRVDGPESAQLLADSTRGALLGDLGMSDSEQLDSRFRHMESLGEEAFQLVGELIRDNRSIIA